ncbi:MAG: HAD-IC family P-type ATPase [Ignavibacteria bacterium]|nr:HAD-IC family P-type ATPase [Ignavibacteria bacterium]
MLSGSFCLSGNGFYKAVKIGSESYAAKITEQAKKYKFDLTPLQKKINSIVKILFLVALFLVALEVGFNTGNMDIDFVRKISTILISLVPQGLVLMATVTFAVGVTRISKLGAIVQRLNAIESFSNVQVVCMDKTGTLTQNILSVYQLNSSFR